LTEVNSVIPTFSGVNTVSCKVIDAAWLTVFVKRDGNLDLLPEMFAYAAQCVERVNESKNVDSE
jgi:hypothetical protein